MREDWEIKNLEELTERINGLWKGKKGPYINVQVYSMSNFTKDSELNHSSEPRSIIARKSQYEKRKLKYGDILVEKSGGGPNQPVGRAIFFDINNDQENTFSNFTTRLRIKEKVKNDVSSKYVHKFLKMLYLNGETEKFQKNSTNIRNLQLKEYLQVEIPIPPLPEQKRIVEILDEAFEAIDQARANVERNIQNAEELFQSKLNDIFSQRGDGWEEKKLSDVYSFKNGLNFTKHEKNEVDGEGILTIDVYNMYRGGLTVDLSELYRVNKEVKESYLLKKGDILFVRSSLKKEGVAWATYFTEYEEDVSYCGFIIRGRPREDLNPEYSVYYCRSPRVRNELIDRSVQSTITNINQKLLSDVDIPIPDKFRQAEIVEELKVFESQKDLFISSYEQKICALNELKKSILQKAFSGELTAGEQVAA